MGGFSPYEVFVLRCVVTVSASLSFLGSIFVLLSFSLLHRTRSFQRVLDEMQMLRSQAVADLISAVSFLLNWWSYDYTVCLVEGVLMQFATLCTILWGSAFAIQTFLVVKRHKRLAHPWVYHVATWGIAFCASFVPLIPKNQYGPSSPVWCWTINNPEWDWLYRGVSFYFWVMGCWALNLVLTLSVIRDVMRNARLSEDLLVSQSQVSDNRRFVRRIVRQTLAYPIMNTFIWIWAIANRIQNAVQPNDPVFFLVFMHGLLVPLQGFTDAIALAWSARLKVLYVDWWRSSRIMRDKKSLAFGLVAKSSSSSASSSSPSFFSSSSSMQNAPPPNSLATSSASTTGTVSVQYRNFSSRDAEDSDMDRPSHRYRNYNGDDDDDSDNADGMRYITPTKSDMLANPDTDRAL
eukprot:ANDGO_01403.mRNA.1 G-protein coupled receptor 1